MNNCRTFVFMNFKTFSLSELKQKAENFCVYQERSHKEVIKKLRDLGAKSEEIDLVIVHLIEDNFLNEERFARNFAIGKHSIKKYGKTRITQELKLKNISEYNIKKALEEISEDQYKSTFNELCEKKWNSIEEKDIVKKKKRFFEYLFYKGYETELIHEYLQNTTK